MVHLAGLLQWLGLDTSEEGVKTHVEYNCMKKYPEERFCHPCQLIVGFMP